MIECLNSDLGMRFILLVVPIGINIDIGTWALFGPNLKFNARLSCLEVQWKHLVRYGV
jgi:hypothetical protein